MSGPPGAGKTTVSALLAGEAERGVHLESDWFFQSIRGGYVYPALPESQEQNEVVMRAVADAAAAYANGGYFTVIEGIISPRWFMNPVRDRLREHGVDAAYAILRAPLEVCLERAHGRARDPVESDDVVRQLYADFEGEFEEHVIDTGALDVAGAATRIRTRLESGDLAI